MQLVVVKIKDESADNMEYVPALIVLGAFAAIEPPIATLPLASLTMLFVALEGWTTVTTLAVDILGPQFSLRRHHSHSGLGAGAARNASSSHRHGELTNGRGRVILEPICGERLAVIRGERHAVHVLAGPQKCRRLADKDWGRGEVRFNGRRSNPDARGGFIVPSDADAKSVDVDRVVVNRRRPRAKSVVPDDGVIADVGRGDDDSISGHAFLLMPGRRLR